MSSHDPHDPPLGGGDGNHPTPAMSGTHHPSRDVAGDTLAHADRVAGAGAVAGGPTTDRSAADEAASAAARAAAGSFPADRDVGAGGRAVTCATPATRMLAPAAAIACAAGADRRPATSALAVAAVVGGLVPAAILLMTSAPLATAAVPAVIFGVPAMTTPALYVALTLLGDAPPMLAVLAAIGRALLALALVLLGLAAPLGFLVATASPDTAQGLITAGVAIAGAVAVIALDDELTAAPGSVGRSAVLWAWVAATAVIAGRLYADVLAGGGA
jgi:hypothetical protein